MGVGSVRAMLGKIALRVLNRVHAADSHKDTTVVVVPSICFLRPPEPIDAEPGVHERAASRSGERAPTRVVLKIALVQNLRHEK